MTSEEIRAKLREFLEGRFPLLRERDLPDDSSLLDAGVIDSLGVLDVVTYLESEFETPIADDDLSPENFDSVDTLVEFVERKRP